jgi:hypothetical protein
MGKVIYMSNVCRIDGCENRIHYRGVCRRHYDQMRASGELVAREEVVAQRGYREEHPLYARWIKWKSAGILAPEWADFWAFVDSVGEPAVACKLLRLDNERPFGPDNFRWSIPVKEEGPATGPTCLVEGCGNTKLHARGYCRAHYLRLRRAGELQMNTEVLAVRGRKEDHLHFHRWSGMRRAKLLCPEWHDDFWSFVDAIGEKGKAGKLLRLDQSKPLGPGNFRWAHKLEGEAKNAYYRDWYKNNTTGRNSVYKKAYGITVADYDRMLAAQGGVCAICKTHPDHKVRAGVNEDTRRLAVDHVHLPDGSSGPVRALLCGSCNTMIGLAKDDPERLREAARYLDHYASQPNESAA